ncbi:hypothetical protein MANES_09G029700v8 [Manihot esculenta]|uniref:Uncharacterized protein n=1 Tax=Manihot esculenta TaxID=3983 RepID=A0A2C9V790_MANES|nr:hypothetical protein MANES_09G029700v8 [Manihot esculenta]
MAEFGASFAHMVMLLVPLFLVYTRGVMPQDIAPSPAMDTGAALALPVSVALMCSSLIVSLFAI